MLNKSLLFVTLCLLMWCCSGTQVQQCKGGKEVQDLNNRVQIGGCNKPPCRLKKDTDVNVTLKFIPKEDVKALKTSVNANILGIPLPFVGVDGEDACRNIFKANGDPVGCNMKAGEEYVYKNKIEVLRIYPKVRAVVHWGLTKPDGKDVICFEVLSKITD